MQISRNILISISLFCLFCFLPSSSHAADRTVKRVKTLSHHSGKLGTYKALVIGINQYSDPNIQDLKTAVKDARTIADVLETQYGFNTLLLLDEQASRNAIYQALRKLASESHEQDSVLIYYAGHGDLDKMYDDGWWIPADAHGGDPLTYLENNQIQKAMRKMAARHVLLISDSCYSGTLFGESRSLPPVITNKYYLSLHKEKSRWGMTSGNKTPVSDSGSKGHSVFAYQLLKELKRTDIPYLSTQELYTRIAPIIRNNSEQTPLCRPVRNTGDQGGEFIFVRVNSSPIAYKEQKSILTMSDSAENVVASGSLTVHTKPSEADVSIDDVFEGTSPLGINNLEPGIIVIKGEKAGYTSVEKRIRIRAGRKSKLTLTLNKSGRTNNDPQSAPLKQQLDSPRLHPKDIFSLLDKYDIEQLNSTFEKNRSGMARTWQNPYNNSRYQATAEPAFQNNSRQPCRKITISATINGQHLTTRATACRDNNAWWHFQ